MMTLTVVIFLVDAIGHGNHIYHLGKLIIIMNIMVLFPGLVIFRTFLLWEKKPKILWLLITGSLMINAVAIVSIGLEVKNMSGKLPSASNFFAKR